MSTPEHTPSPQHHGSGAPTAHAAHTAVPSPPGSDPTSITATLKDVDARLRGRRIARSDRAAITDGLRADFLAAQADGRDPRHLLGPDVDDFVRRVVAEGDYATTTHNPVPVAVMGTLLAIPAVVVAYVLTFGAVVPLFSAVVSPHLDLPRTGVAGGWVGTAAAGTLAVLAVLGLVLRGRPGSRQTLTAAVLTVSAAAVIAALGNILILQLAPRISTGSVVLQVLVVLLPLAGALGLARWWGLRRAGS